MSVEPVDANVGLALRDMDCAIETIARSRRLASEYRQRGLHALADFYRDNANGAERWLIRAGKAHPLRCNSLGQAIK